MSISKDRFQSGQNRRTLAVEIIADTPAVEGGNLMKLLIHTTAAACLLAALSMPVVVLQAHADRGDDHDHDHGHDRGDDHGYHGAPGPIVGAGLPVLAIGYGVYWLVKRRRKPNR